MKHFPLGLLLAHSVYLFAFPQHINIASAVISVALCGLYGFSLWQGAKEIPVDPEAKALEEDLVRNSLIIKRKLQDMEAEIQEKRFQLQKFNMDNEYSLKSVSKTSDGQAKKFSF